MFCDKKLELTCATVRSASSTSFGTSETFLVFKAKSFLRTVTVSGAGVLCFPDTPIMCLRVLHDIDAVIWVKNT